MNDLRAIERNNAKAARHADYPKSLLRGSYRLKHNPTASAGAIYADRKGKEYLLSLADSLLWEREGKVADAPHLIPFASKT